MRTGNVTMNGTSHFRITSPFGGTKQSGLGRRNGTDGFEEYLGSKPSACPTETTTVDVQEISD
jgi:aldehyde dehydrogenase (NAD+)